MEKNESVLEEQTEQNAAKKGITNRNKVCLLLLGIALILWIFAPFYQSYYYKITAPEIISYAFQDTEYREVITETREFWISLVAGACIAIGFIALLKNKEKRMRVCSVVGILALAAPMLELVFYIVKNFEWLPKNLLGDFFSSFGWGYWGIAAIYLAVAFLCEGPKKD